MAIVDIQTDRPVLTDIESVGGAGGHSNASAAYSSWAAEHGLPAAGTVSPFDGDDTLTVLDIGFPPLIGSTETRIAVTGEAGVMFYRSPLTGTSATPATVNVGGVSLSRMYVSSGVAPSALFTFRPDSQDSGVGSSKWQKGAGVAILFFKTGPYSAPTSTDVAVRVKPASLEFVITVNTEQSQKFAESRFRQFDGDFIADAAKYIASSLSGTSMYRTRQPFAISGIVKNEDAVPVARIVRAYRRSDGALSASAVSNGATGTYSMQVLDAGEYNVVCLDDAAGETFNDLILRTTAA